ncbi:MAG: glycoside hydrolase family 3 protein [Lachnospiraceae bacterium]|nr:glycoside hydrolase family 3 protein [Lachnospiraceae bacterium]
MDITKAPFFLDKQATDWVEETLRSMTTEEKIGQLFCPIGYSTDRDYLEETILRYHIGGLFFRDGRSDEMRDTFDYAQRHSRIPLLIPSNLEAGGDGAATDGTPYGKQMSVAAAGDPQYAYRLGKIACREGAALGINLAFAPVVDLDLNYHNPITNVRTYGSDTDVVIANAKEYLRAAKECGVATSVKHFPGDGVDERDQHLLTSVNSLSVAEWEASYGRIYRAMIEAGTLTVMAGHIAFPAFENQIFPGHRGRIIPATLSSALLKNLLREKLGFNGLIISDATPMVGYTSAMDRRTALPTSIENGCDMILFNKDLAEDFTFMMEGYRKGILSEERLEDACRRILATKAALLLPERREKGTLVPPREALSVVRCREHAEWARELADRSVTLVKDTAGLLPLSPQNTKRVLLEILGEYPSTERVTRKMQRLLKEQGFSVKLYEKEDFDKGVDNVTQFREKYDLVIYVANIENASNQTTTRLNWYTFWGQGNNVPWFAEEVPVLFISLANPYHLLDVPMLKTYINAYSNNDDVMEAVVEKVMGRSEFTGISPVDPFCGREELAY